MDTVPLQHAAKIDGINVHHLYKAYLWKVNPQMNQQEILWASFGLHDDLQSMDDWLDANLPHNNSYGDDDYEAYSDEDDDNLLADDEERMWGH